MGDTQGGPLGLDVEVTTNGLMVQEVLRGPLKSHNILSSDEAYVCKQDFVVKINGRSDPDAMIKKIEIEPHLKLDLVHPKYLKVNIDTTTTPLGVELHSVGESSTVFEVKTINAGAVNKFNTNCVPEDRVEVEDVI